MTKEVSKQESTNDHLYHVARLAFLVGREVPTIPWYALVHVIRHGLDKTYQPETVQGILRSKDCSGMLAELIHHLHQASS